MGNVLGPPPSPSSSSPSLPSLLSSHPVFLFSSTRCAYCRVAKRAFDELGTEYAAAEVDRMDPEEGAGLARQVRDATGGRATVPQVFICGRWIGGCQETRDLMARGELQVRSKSSASLDGVKLANFINRASSYRDRWEGVPKQGKGTFCWET